MSTHRCRAPGGGQPVFPPATQATDTALEPEIAAIREVLGQVMNEIKGAEARAKLVPRIVSVAIQAYRTRHQIGAPSDSELLALIAEVERELDGSPST